MLPATAGQEHSAGADPVWRCRNALFWLLRAILFHRNRSTLQCSGRISFPNNRSRFLISSLLSLFSFSPTRNRAFLDWLFRSLEAHKESKGWVMAVCMRWEQPDGCWRGRRRSECWVVRFDIPNKNASLDQTENYFKENKFSFMFVVLYIS